MRSDKQLQASRANGAKSRGPVTAEGKRNTSQNSIRHGAFAREVRLRNESKAEFEEFAQAMIDEFQPRTVFESTLVDSMISAHWRAIRLSILEKALVDHEIENKEKQIATGSMGEDAVVDAPTVAAVTLRDLADKSRAPELFSRYEVRFARQYLRAHKRLMDVRDRRRDTPPPAQPGPNVVPISENENIENREQTQQPVENTQNAPSSFFTPKITTVARPAVRAAGD